jgi:hypothetical protein
MTPEYEKRLETEVSRALKGLPELQAPSTLARRVLGAIEQHQAVAWYRRPWQFWPLSLRLVSLAVLLALFGGLSFGAWQLESMHGYDLLAQELGRWLAPFLTLCNAVMAVLAALGAAVKQLGMPILISSAAALALAWAMCLGLGTLCVRLAFARR